jgi:hypothetical protein
MFSHRREFLGGRRVGVQELFEHPNATDIDRDQFFRDVGADYELRRAAADVDDQLGLVRIELLTRSQEGSAGLLIAREQFRFVAGELPNPLEEFVPVVRVTDRTRPGDSQSLDLILSADRGVIGDHRKGSLQRFGGQYPTTVDPLAQAGDRHPAIERAEA